MPLNPNTEALLLLLAKFGADDSIPLTPREWRRLKPHFPNPAELLSTGRVDELVDWESVHLSAERVQRLMDRGLAHGIAVSHWESAGVWILNYLDDDYPTRLLDRLGSKCPPLLFGCGDSGALGQGGIAVVGSRKASNEAFQYARDLGRAAAEQGVAVVSGAALGVDREAMRGAVEYGGRVTGVLIDQLLKKASALDSRHTIMDGRLVLVTHTEPERSLYQRYNPGLYVGAAMQRNHYIYCLADDAVVAHSKSGKGGTWSGAMDNIKKQWVPLWVPEGKEFGPGNSKLSTYANVKVFPRDTDPQHHIRLVRGTHNDKDVVLPNEADRLDTRRLAQNQTASDKIAILLLTTALSNDWDFTVEPLDHREWGSFANELLSNGHWPSDLLGADAASVLAKTDGGLTRERISKLVDIQRRQQLEENQRAWEKKGFWYITRGDRDYPSKLKKELRTECPAVLFGTGDRKLLQCPGIAVLSLESKEEADHNYALEFGRALAKRNQVLITPRASRLEKEALGSVLTKGGIGLWICTTPPARASKQYKQYLDAKKLLILSLFPPGNPNPTGKNQNSLFLADVAIGLANNAVILRAGKRGRVIRAAAACQKRGNVPLWYLQVLHPRLFEDAGRMGGPLKGGNADEHAQLITGGLGQSDGAPNFQVHQQE